ncbi:hypothetical protein C8Q74DRAFT_755288 [Fomes fomentarius]|nr:hypothetical protein C8Q74DRAFT_755288 [Fomes fomentarius]
MSSIPEDALSELEIVLQGIFTGNYCSIAAIALLVYEWLITIRKEVELFWREPVSGATILFLFNRYLPLLLVLSDFFVILTRSNPSCKVLGWAFVWLGLLQYVPWALFSTMRAYAMSGRRWSVAALVLLLSTLPELGCGVISTVSLRLAKIHNRVPVISDPGGCGRRRHNLDDNISHCATGRDTPERTNILESTSGTTELSNTSFVVIFIEPFTAILVSRFLTDLQAVKTRTQHRASETGWSTSGSSSFLDRAALGAVGYALEPGDFQVVSHSASTVETLDPSETEEAGSMDRTLRDSEDQTTSVF